MCASLSACFLHTPALCVSMCLHYLSVCFCLAQKFVYMQRLPATHVDPSNRGEKNDTHRLAVPCFRERLPYFFPWKNPKVHDLKAFWLILELVWMFLRELTLMIICHPFNSHFGCYFSCLLLWSFKCPCLAKKVLLYHLYCQFDGVIIRMNGVFMASDACAANS